MWENEAKAITENIEVPLMYDLMIPSGVNIENKALRPDIIVGYKKKREEGFATCSVNAGDFGLTMQKSRK